MFPKADSLQVNLYEEDDFISAQGGIESPRRALPSRPNSPLLRLGPHR
jgi:hypothetical protein